MAFVALSRRSSVFFEDYKNMQVTLRKLQPSTQQQKCEKGFVENVRLFSLWISIHLWK